MVKEASLLRLTPSLRQIFVGDGMAAIITRQLLGVVILFALLDIGFVLVTYMRDREGLGQRLLSLQADEIGAAITVAGAQVHFRPARLNREPIGDARVAFAAFDRQGKEIARGGPLELVQALMPPITSVASETRRDDHPNGFILRGVRKIVVQGQPFWIAITVEGQGLRPFWPVIRREMIEHVGVPLMPLASLLLMLNVAVVRRALKPLSMAVAEIEALKPRQIERRLTVPAIPREVRRLVGAMNQALDRIESTIGALRDFTADAAHELRTPLAIMSMEVDALPSSVAKTKLQKDLAATSRLVGQMLDMASADALLISEGATADLNAITSEVVAQLTPLALRKGHSIRFLNKNAPVIAGHAEAIGRAVRNLIENALAYTPEETEIEVSSGPGPVIAVRDYGPGIPLDKRQTALKRFSRGERDVGNGSGLGLAIAQRIAEAHGGAVEIADAPGGGALIRLSLKRKTR
ncbi:HAMP domain-containing sensor histidine kinase [Methylovirgula sp. HY1]|uniref:sensor histidine kinase n=1 Tax=Methylovirgula sp. HY1 TaxID=2822761 RepID=UPI001C5BF07C|nr:HAMP domain-containing sensor histidine kinase [Methylovirgula sp. HY1]QXX76588.1 Sensor protein QseC [Methylovirgula sp. HY1]